MVPPVWGDIMTPPGRAPWRPETIRHGAAARWVRSAPHEARTEDCARPAPAQAQFREAPTAGAAQSSYSTLRTCSRTLPSSTLKSMTRAEISGSAVLAPRVPISRPISWARKVELLADGAGLCEEGVHLVEMAAQADQLLVHVGPVHVERDLAGEALVVGPEFDAELGDALAEALVVLDLGEVGALGDRLHQPAHAPAAFPEVGREDRAFGGPHGGEFAEGLPERVRGQVRQEFVREVAAVLGRRLARRSGRPHGYRSRDARGGRTRAVPRGCGTRGRDPGPPSVRASRLPARRRGSG